MIPIDHFLIYLAHETMSTLVATLINQMNYKECKACVGILKNYFHKHLSKNYYFLNLISQFLFVNYPQHKKISLKTFFKLSYVIKAYVLIFPAHTTQI